MQLIHSSFEEVITKIKDKSIDLIFADLPFNQLDGEWDSKLDLYFVWREFYRVLNVKGNIAFCCNLNWLIQNIMVIKELKLPLIYFDLVWEKNNVVQVQTADIKPLVNHELVVIFRKRSDSTYNPIYNELRKKTKKPTLKKAILNSKNPNIYDINKKNLVYENKENPRSVMHLQDDLVTYVDDQEGTLLQVDRDKQIIHPTQKPLLLCKKLVYMFSNPNDLVADFTMGSGNSIKAAKQLGRDYIGVERDKTFFDKAIANINQRSIFDIAD